jgi:hypothetical protein
MRCLSRSQSHPEQAKDPKDKPVVAFAICAAISEFRKVFSLSSACIILEILLTKET